MPFVVIDQGVRITTPANRIFPEPTVNPVGAGAAAAGVATQARQQAPAERKPNTTRQAKSSADAGATGSIPAPVPAKVVSRYYDSEEPLEHHRVYRAAEIMTTSLLTLRPDDTVATAWQHFQRHTFHHIPVVDDAQQLLAVVSDRDIWLRLSDWRQFQRDQAIREIMQPRVVCATEDTDIRMLAAAMANRQIGSVPIVDQSDATLPGQRGKLLGIVTRTDILKLVMNQPALQLWV